MRLTEDECEEYFRIVKKQRDMYKNLLANICIGVPTILGMASEYRQLTLKEIQKLARELLDD
jgi:hypothetical protein